MFWDTKGYYDCYEKINRCMASKLRSTQTNHSGFTHVYFLHLCVPTYIPTICFRGIPTIFIKAFQPKSSCSLGFPSTTAIPYFHCQGAARWICPMDHRAHAPNDRRRFDTWPGIEQSQKRAPNGETWHKPTLCSDLRLAIMMRRIFMVRVRNKNIRDHNSQRVCACCMKS